MLNILILHAQTTYPLRTTSWDNLYCFRHHSNHRCYYLNVAYHNPPGFIKKVDFDIIIFHDLFVCARWAGNEIFNKLLKRILWLKKSNGIKIVIPQDEFIYSDLLCNIINEFEIKHVFSVSPPSEWEKIYNTVDFDKVKFHTVLTGYLNKTTLNRINKIAKTIPSVRPIDIGYRARYHNPWIGSHGMLKSTIAEQFSNNSKDKDLKIDISMKEKDVFVGDDWYKFLLHCKYTIGVEGGASILDRDGSIREKTELYIKDNPNASFSQIEKTCFPNRDGELKLFALSPRHLEACATKTCQVLIEGYYNGVLESGKHYIELKKDFSNIKEVIDTIIKDDMRAKLTCNAYKDIVESGLYEDSGFVEYVITNSLKNKSPIDNGFNLIPKTSFPYYAMLLVELISWVEIALITVATKIAKNLLPSKIIDWIKVEIRK